MCRAGALRPTIAVVFSLVLLLVLGVQKHLLLNNARSKVQSWTPVRRECYNDVAFTLLGDPSLASSVWSSFFPADTFASTIVDITFTHSCSTSPGATNSTCPGATKDITVASRTMWLVGIFNNSLWRAWVHVTSMGALPAQVRFVEIPIIPRASRGVSEVTNETSGEDYMNPFAARGYPLGVQSRHWRHKTPGTDAGRREQNRVPSQSACCNETTDWALLQAAMDLPRLARPGFSLPSSWRAAKFRGRTDVALWARTPAGLREISETDFTAWGVITLVFMLVISFAAGFQMLMADLVHHDGPDFKWFHRYFALFAPNMSKATVFLTYLACFTLMYALPAVSAIDTCGSSYSDPSTKKKDVSGCFMVSLLPLLGNLFLSVVPSLCVWLHLKCSCSTRESEESPSEVTRKEDVIHIAYSVSLSVFVACSALSMQLALVGLAVDWTNAINPLAQLTLAFSYFFIIANTRVKHGKIVPIEFNVDVQIIRKFQYDSQLAGAQPFTLANNILNATEFEQLEFIYNNRGKIRIIRDRSVGTTIDDNFKRLLETERPFLSLLLEPVMWLIFLVVLNTLTDNIEVFAGNVLASVLTLGAVSLAMWPKLTNLMADMALREKAGNVVTAIREIRRENETPNEDKMHHIRFLLATVE